MMLSYTFPLAVDADDETVNCKIQSVTWYDTYVHLHNSHIHMLWPNNCSCRNTSRVLNRLESSARHDFQGKIFGFQCRKYGHHNIPGNWIPY